MLKQFFQNCAYPQGVGGSLMLSLMNLGHRGLAKWAFTYMPLKQDDHVLDIGCGGGKNITRMLKRVPMGHVTGLDYSGISVLKSLLANARAVKNGRAQILEGGVSAMPFADNRFDVITAFETVYFWPDLQRDFAEVYRVLKPGGLFFICNSLQASTAGHANTNFWTRTIGLTLYDNASLQGLLERSGFCRTELFTGRKQKKLCLLAHKTV